MQRWKTIRELVASTRASKLALHQTNSIIKLLKKQNNQARYTVETVTTKGDKDNRPFHIINQIGIFEKEVNDMLLKYKADFAVHSLKDLHAGISNRLVVACIPKRETPNDIFINNFDNSPINKLKAGSVIGTSSIRRALQIKTEYPLLIVKAIRGNIETRINRSKENHYGGIILAEAGIKRAGLRNMITQRLSTQSFVPAPGQGALAIVCRKDDAEIIKIVKEIEDEPSRKEIIAERALIDIIGAGCTVPVGALAKTNKKNNTMSLHASIYSLDGKRIIKHKEQGDPEYPEILGKRAGEALISKGAIELTKEWIKNNNINSSSIKEFIINE